MLTPLSLHPVTSANCWSEFKHPDNNPDNSCWTLIDNDNVWLARTGERERETNVCLYVCVLRACVYVVQFVQSRFCKIYILKKAKSVHNKKKQCASKFTS